MQILKTMDFEKPLDFKKKPADFEKKLKSTKKPREFLCETKGQGCLEGNPYIFSNVNLINEGTVIGKTKNTQFLLMLRHNILLEFETHCYV